jgi:hypothetical protein
MVTKKRKPLNKKVSKKKVIRKKTSKKKIVKRKPAKKVNTRRIKRVKHEKDIKIEKMLVENFISLQKVMVNLSVKFGDLSGDIKKLLETFDIAAKALSEKEMVGINPKEESESILNKLSGLEDQNKILARGLTLMHEKVPHPSETETYSPTFQKPLPPPMNQIPNPIPNPLQPQSSSQQNSLPIATKDATEKGINFEGYQKSISSK